MNHSQFAVALRWSRLILVTAAVPLLASCSEGDAGTFQPATMATAAVPADAGKLIPADAIGILQIQSIDGFKREVMDVVKSFQPGTEGVVAAGLSALVQMSGLRERDLDLSGCGIVALTMSNMGPSPTIILASKDASGAVDIASLPAVASGGYLGIGLGAPPKIGAATPDFAKDLPAADLTIRLNLEALIKATRPMFEQYLDINMLRDLDPNAVVDPVGESALKAMLDMVKSCLDTAKALDIDISLEGGALDVGFSFDAGEPAGLARVVSGMGAIDLVRMLPGDVPAILYFGDGRFDKLIDMMLPMYRQMGAAMPGDQGDAMVQMLTSSKQVYALVDGGYAFGMNFGPGGMAGSMVLGSRDPAALLSGMEELFTSNAMMTAGGMNMQPGEKTEVAGHEFTTYSMEFNMAKLMEMQGRELPEGAVQMQEQMMKRLFGEDGLRFGLGIVGDYLVSTIGGSSGDAASLVAAAKAGPTAGGTTGWVPAGVIAKLRTQPIIFVSVDLRKILKQMSSLMEGMAPMPSVPAGDPIAVWMAYGERDGRHLGQLHVDLAGIAALVKSMR